MTFSCLSAATSAGMVPRIAVRTACCRCFWELETSKGGSDIIDCLPRAHRAALSLELLGISHTQTGLESRPAALSEGTAGPRKQQRRVA